MVHVHVPVPGTGICRSIAPKIIVLDIQLLYMLYQLLYQLYQLLYHLLYQLLYQLYQLLTSC